MEYDSAWFFGLPPGDPFEQAGVDAALVDYAIAEASFDKRLVCAKTWCPDRYEFALAIKTAMILYAQGEPNNTAMGGVVVPPAGSQPTEYISHVKRDTVGPLTREYDKAIKNETHGKAIPDLNKRLDDLLAHCRPPKGVGFMSLAGLNRPRSGCGCSGSSGLADKADDDDGFPVVPSDAY